MGADWLDNERTLAAEARLLSVAEELFATRGVENVTMADIATAAQCSRATLYRYYPTRNDILTAYVCATTERIFADIITKTAGLSGATEQVSTAISMAINAIRTDPALGPWFEPDAGLPAKIAVSNTAITAALTRFMTRISSTGAPAERDVDLARWLTRTIIALIVMPEPSPESEAAHIGQFVTPVLLGHLPERGR
jgi:AcrR family transcriptional regulator